MLGEHHTNPRRPQAVIDRLMKTAEPRMHAMLEIWPGVMGAEAPPVLVPGAALDQPAWWVEAMVAWAEAIQDGRKKWRPKT